MQLIFWVITMFCERQASFAVNRLKIWKYKQTEHGGQINAAADAASVASKPPPHYQVLAASAPPEIHRKCWPVRGRGRWDEGGIGRGEKLGMSCLLPALVDGENNMVYILLELLHWNNWVSRRDTSVCRPESKFVESKIIWYGSFSAYKHVS